MLIPALMEQLGESNTTLGEASGEDAVGSVGSWCPGVLTVHLENLVGLIGEVGDLRNRGLHPPGEFVAVIGCSALRARLRILEIVQSEQCIEHLSPHRSRQSVGILEKEHRILTGTELDPLMFRWQEARSPQS